MNFIIHIQFHNRILFFPALPRTSQRIVGGSLATISQYPYAVAMLYGTSSYFQSCGGTILTSTAVLSAAQCVV